MARNPALDRAVQARVHAGQFDAAIRLVQHMRGLEPSYAGLLQAELAQGLFFANRDAEALGVAEVGFRAGGGRTALAAFVAGLAAWRLDRPDLARTWFEAAWRAPGTEPSMRAGAAFWAARAELRTGAAGGYSFWLGRAAREGETFYGRIARQVTGWAGNPVRPAVRPTLSFAEVQLVDETPSGHRAFALLQVGQPDRAEAELRRLWGTAWDVPGLGRAIALVAERAGLADFSAALMSVLEERPDASGPVATPLPLLRPAGGFRVDQALVYGVARVESNFDAGAVSPVGATGLMQLMPVTATYLANDGKPVASSLVGQMLRDPGRNLRLGQRYLLFLADALDGDLLRMLAAYNTGLGGFNRWNGEVRHMDDPLMFIESIPIAETRAYVSRALLYTWTYAAQLHLPPMGLDDLAAGVWPRFVSAPEPHAVAGRRLH